MPTHRVCNLVDVPQVIKHIRKKKKLSQRKLASKINVDNCTVSAYEKGRIQPSLKSFLTILNIGGYSISLIEDIYKTPKPLNIPD